MPRSNRHSARVTAGASSPAGSFTGGFRTTAPVQAESSRWAVIRNPSHNRTCAVARSSALGYIIAFATSDQSSIVISQGFVGASMANDEHVALLKQGVAAWNA